MSDIPIHVSISEAAEMLGMCIVQTRRWFDSGKLKGFRHPINNYRRVYLSSINQMIKTTKSDGKYRKNKKCSKETVA